MPAARRRSVSVSEVVAVRLFGPGDRPGNGGAESNADNNSFHAALLIASVQSRRGARLIWGRSRLLIVAAAIE